MEDVAREAGVSKSTVLLALNDKPGISAELKQTVLQAVAALGYRLSCAAIWWRAPRALRPQLFRERSVHREAQSAQRKFA
jgi:DNA-binding LacI/PurR family transcriptional regulator